MQPLLPNWETLPRGWCGEKVPPFEPFPKVPRLMRPISISEKIDGTNASVLVMERDATEWRLRKLQGFPSSDFICYEGDVAIMAASRKRWIHPGKGSDNAGFARWVWDNAAELSKLGVGHHFGEWWGKGIQRNYGMDRKVFSLFNPRWLELVESPGNPFEMVSVAPACVSVVPQLFSANYFNIFGIRLTLEKLNREGSRAAPGFMNPEGIVVYHHAANQLFKYTLEGDGHKGDSV